MVFDESQCKIFSSDLTQIRYNQNEINRQLSKFEKCISLVYSEEIDRYDNGLVKMDNNGKPIIKYVKPIDSGTNIPVTEERQNDIMNDNLIKEINDFLTNHLK